MKKIVLLVLVFALAGISCKKETEETIDCLTELIFTTIGYQASQNNPKEIILTVSYTGSFTVTVEWSFGDGIKETKQGTSITHVYGSSGDYFVEAIVTLTAPDMASCCTTKEKTITVL